MAKTKRKIEKEGRRRAPWQGAGQDGKYPYAFKFVL